MESLDIQRSSSGFYSEADVSLKKRVRRIVVTGIGLIMFQQLCGANMMIFRAEEVFDGLNPVDDAPVRAPIYAIVLSATQVSMAFSRPMPSPPEYGIYTRYRNTWLIVSTRAQVLLCSISVELVEILGRKFMLITSGVGMSLCLLALIVHYALHTKDCFEFSEPDWHKYIPVILVALYTCSYSIGWGSVVILVYTEIIYFDVSMFTVRINLKVLYMPEKVYVVMLWFVFILNFIKSFCFFVITIGTLLISNRIAHTLYHGVVNI
jgi:hypothetical protein